MVHLLGYMHMVMVPYYMPTLLRLVQAMETTLSQMQAVYDTLTQLLSEATVNPQDMDKFFGWQLK